MWPVTRSRADANGRDRRQRAERAGGRSRAFPATRRKKEKEKREESASAINFAPSFWPFLLFLNYLFEVHCWTPNYSVAALVVGFLETDKEHFVLLLSSSKFGSWQCCFFVFLVSVVGVLHFARLALLWVFQRENLLRGVSFLGM